MSEKVATSGFRSVDARSRRVVVVSVILVGSSSGLGDNDQCPSRRGKGSQELLDIVSGLLEVSLDIEGEPRGFRQGKAEVWTARGFSFTDNLFVRTTIRTQGDSTRDCTESDQ